MTTNRVPLTAISVADSRLSKLKLIWPDYPSTSSCDVEILTGIRPAGEIGDEELTTVGRVCYVVKERSCRICGR